MLLISPLNRQRTEKRGLIAQQLKLAFNKWSICFRIKLWFHIHSTHPHVRIQRTFRLLVLISKRSIWQCCLEQMTYSSNFKAKEWKLKSFAWSCKKYYGDVFIQLCPGKRLRTLDELCFCWAGLSPAMVLESVIWSGLWRLLSFSSFEAVSIAVCVSNTQFWSLFAEFPLRLSRWNKCLWSF